MLIIDGPSTPASEGNTDFGKGIIILSILLSSLSCIFVAMRFAVRGGLVKSLGWDDYTILLAAIGTIIGMGLDFVEVHYGYGRHQQFLSAHQLQEYKKYTFGEWIQTFATLMWTKISICLFLLRIPVSKWLIRPLQIALVSLIVSNVILTFLYIFQCSPVAAAWDDSKQGKCASRFRLEAITFAQALVSMISDFAFAAYPIALLWNVQISLRTKIGLICLMGLGFFTGACCIVRTVLNDGAIPIDVTYGGIINWIWRAFEVNFGIIAACIPTLPPGYRWLRDLRGNTKTLSTDHFPLADTPTGKLQGYSSHSNPNNVNLSYNNIIKTTRVDVEPGVFV